MSKATDRFKNDTYVREYYQTAQENEARMNGTKDMEEPTVPQAAQQDSLAVQPVAPLTNLPKP
jgi:hypothetical protein